MNGQAKLPDFFWGFNHPSIPANVRLSLEEAFTQSRTAYSQIDTAAHHCLAAWGKVTDANLEGAKRVGEQVLSNVRENTDAALEAAHAVARAKTVADAVEVQRGYWHSQFASNVAQAKELWDLVAEVAQHSVEITTSVTSKTITEIKKAA